MNLGMVVGALVVAVGVALSQWSTVAGGVMVVAGLLYFGASIEQEET